MKPKAAIRLANASQSTRCPDVVAARASYEAALQEILGFFACVSDFIVARGQLLACRPDHLGLESVAEPLMPGASKLLADTRLFDLENGAQVWPDPQQTNRLAVAMSQSVLGMVASMDLDKFSPFWWRAVQRRQAAAAAEAELQGKRFAEMKIEQEARQNAEEQERFAEMHGGGVK
jgi:hypothetical protein